MDGRLSTLSVIHRAYRRRAQIITTKGRLVLNTTSVYQITPGLGKKVSTTRVGMRVPTPKSLVLITTSIYLINPGMGKKVSTSSRGLGVKDYTPSMKVTTSSGDLNFP